MKNRCINNPLRVISYNCISLRNKVDVVGELLECCEIFLCRKVILFADDCNFLQGMSISFNFLFSPSSTPLNDLAVSHPSGGMVIFL